MILYLYCLQKYCWDEKNKVLHIETYWNKVGKCRDNNDYIMEDGKLMDR